jgi:hypothetical protein
MATQDSRIKIKRSTITATVPTVPSSNDHTDGTWIATDIYKGELFFNQADGVLWSRDDNGVVCLGGSASIELNPAQVLSLNSTPLTIVGAVAGYAIEVVSASMKIVFNTTAYATNTTLTLITSGATEPQADNSIDATVSRNGKFRHRYTSGASATTTQMIANADLQVSVDLGNPTAGDSDITVYVNYRLIPA